MLRQFYRPISRRTANRCCPLVSGAGKSQDPDHHPTATSSYTATYLDTSIQHQLIAQLAARRHVEVTQADLDQAHTAYTNQISQVMTEIQ